MNNERKRMLIGLISLGLLIAIVVTGWVYVIQTLIHL